MQIWFLKNKHSGQRSNSFHPINVVCCLRATPCHRELNTTIPKTQDLQIQICATCYSPTAVFDIRLRGSVNEKQSSVFQITSGEKLDSLVSSSLNHFSFHKGIQWYVRVAWMFSFLQKFLFVSYFFWLISIILPSMLLTISVIGFPSSYTCPCLFVPAYNPFITFPPPFVSLKILPSLFVVEPCVCTCNSWRL